MLSQVQLQQRYVLCLLIFTGLVTNYMLRINMSIAIVTMAGGDNSTQSPCSDPDNGTDSGGEGGDTDSLGWNGSEAVLSRSIWSSKSVIFHKLNSVVSFLNFFQK